RRDHGRPRETPPRLLIDGLPSGVADPPPAVFPPLPPGPADPEPVGLVESRVSVGQGSLLGQVVTELADPERRRDFSRLLDALLEALAQEGWVTRPERRNQGPLIEVGALNTVRRLELNHHGVHGEQQDALHHKQVVGIDGANRLDRLLEHRPQVVLVKDPWWDWKRVGFIEDVIARDPRAVLEA